jgi:hypothetical protein
VLKFEEGAKCLVYKGIHAPEVGIIEKINRAICLWIRQLR